MEMPVVTLVRHHQQYTTDPSHVIAVDKPAPVKGQPPECRQWLARTSLGAYYTLSQGVDRAAPYLRPITRSEAIWLWERWQANAGAAPWEKAFPGVVVQNA